MNTLKSYSRIGMLAVAIVTATLFTTAGAGIDKKFYKKVAEDVWSKSDAIFNPATVIPDSLLENNSAVIIAWSDDIDVDHVAQPTPYKASGLTNRIKKTHVKHMMIKLLDQSAIEDNSEFKFGLNGEVSIMSRLLVYQLKSAFGARIHKPDGRIVDIDLSDAIEVGEGKKGKDYKSYKIAIPGLEPGDILEYFNFEDEMVESSNLDPDDVLLCSTYPVMNRHLSVTTNPAMTVEYKGYNGVPNLSRGENEKGRPTGTLNLTNIPGVNFKRFTMTYRQVPFVRFQFLNNTRPGIIARNSRAGGLYGNIHAGKIISELGDYITEAEYDCPINGKAVKLVKDNFIKQNPEATPRQIADAAWMAVNYYDRTAKNKEEGTSGQFERALVFTDVLKKLKVYPETELGIGILNPRSDVPTRDISAWDESRFVIKTPDALYFMPLTGGIAPGEVPGRYKGETAAIFSGDRKKLSSQKIIGEYTVPGKKVTENSGIFRDTVTIVNDDQLLVTSSASFTGAVKSDMEDLINDMEWIRDVEDYFKMSNDKRYKNKKYDRAGRPDEIKKTLKEYAKNFYGAEPDSVKTVIVSSHGITPDNTSLTYYSESEFSGLVERLGDDISISIGRLTGMPKPLTDSERKRLLDVMLPFISQETHIILVKAPEGYKFDEASVNSLARNVSETVGQFLADPKITDDGDLLLSTAVKYKFADVPLSHWPSFMNLIDQAAAFGDATVILVKK